MHPWLVYQGIVYQEQIHTTNIDSILLVVSLWWVCRQSNNSARDNSIIANYLWSTVSRLDSHPPIFIDGIWKRRNMPGFLTFRKATYFVTIVCRFIEKRYIQCTPQPLYCTMNSPTLPLLLRQAILLLIVLPKKVIRLLVLLLTAFQ